MPIRIPNGLPAISVLQGEEVFVMTEDRALHQDIRPLNLLFLNLMPKRLRPRSSTCAVCPTRRCR